LRELGDKVVSVKGAACGRGIHLAPHVKACPNIPEATKTRYLQLHEEITTKIRSTESSTSQFRTPLSPINPNIHNLTSHVSIPALSSQPFLPLQHYSQTLPGDGPPLKRPRPNPSHSGPIFTPAFDQEQFEIDLLYFIASNELSFNMLDSPETRFFFGKYIPQAQHVSRRKMSDTILPREIDKVIADTRRATENQIATVSSDGWKNNADVDIMSSTMVVNGQPYTLQSHDMTGCEKDGEVAHSVLLEDIEYAKSKLGVRVAAICTDDGPDFKKARRLLREKSPNVVTSVCWAHQGGLLTGNYLKIRTSYSSALDDAHNIVKFINAHKFTRDALMAQQLQMFQSLPSPAAGPRIPLKLFLPGQTRWTAQFASGRRTERLQKPIICMVVCNRDKLREVAASSRSDDAVARGDRAIKSIDDPQFWQRLKK
jgi:hypothetical protein